MDNPAVFATIGKPWQHEGEPNRIHYMVTKADGTKRHLYADRDSPWFKLLNPIVQGTMTPRSKEPGRDLAKGLHHVGYALQTCVASGAHYAEAARAMETARAEGRQLDADRYREEANAFLESLLLQARSLIDFFIHDKPWPNDLHRSDYPIKDWSPAPQEAATWLRPLRDELNKRLAHLTWPGIERGDPTWEPPQRIVRDLVAVASAWREVLDDADPDLAVVLAEPLRNCRQRLATPCPDTADAPGPTGVPQPRDARAATGPTGSAGIAPSGPGGRIA